MALHYHQDDISLSSLRQDLKNYSLQTFQADATAALSVALLTIPQALAYAVLAGLPLYCGLFAAIYASMVAAFFGSSRHLIVGPSNAIAILVQAGTSEILFNFYRDATGPEREALAVQILASLSFLSAVIQMLAASFKLGRLVQFVSYSVIIGYMAGSAVAVFVNQLYTFLGLNRMPGVHSLYQDIFYIITHVYKLHWPSTLIGLITLCSIVLFKRIDKRIPAAIAALAFSSILVYIIDYSNGLWNGISDSVDLYHTVPLVGDTGDFSTLWPNIAWPSFESGVLNALLPFAFAVALLSIMETTTVSKSVAASSGQHLSVNQEILGVGLGNLVAAFISAMPISGSASRTVLSYSQGAQTRFASILNAVIVASFLYLFSYSAGRIPLTALAALLLFTSINIVNFKQLSICNKATRSDAFVLWTTFFSCIFLSLDLAFYIGVILSIVLYLKKAAIPQLVEYDVEESGELRNPIHHNEHRNIRIIKVEGELFFGAADLFQTTLKTLTEDDTHTKVIVLQLKNARDIDATSCLALQQLFEYLRNSHRYLLACGITQPIWDVLSDSGLVEIIGKENLYIFDEKHPHYHMQKALMRARFLATSPEPKPLPKVEEAAKLEEILIPPTAESDTV
ncbi:putative sulfate transporterc/MT1781 [Candidatus Rubidus massiliensis]|nr:putative sulfate transporterc/MT1781 [Candidatus Rubidus massiliensis]